ncbi:MAG: ntpD [Chlamydiia bacterium]|nr:ntpD [Chlamydiia bacterium]
MAEIKLTKNELRMQQNKLNQLLRYLPTLQLKKALLQAQVNDARVELHRLDELLNAKKLAVDEYASLFAQKLSINVYEYAHFKEIKKHYENIAGCDVPVFDSVTYQDLNYDLFDTPIWLEGALLGLRELSQIQAQALIEEEKKRALEKELREVSIRVNLFEKILIPRCNENIKTIKVFLGDQQLAAVAQAKVAKAKIELIKIAEGTS